VNRKAGGYKALSRKVRALKPRSGILGAAGGRGKIMVLIGTDDHRGNDIFLSRSLQRVPGDFASSAANACAFGDRLGGRATAHEGARRCFCFGRGRRFAGRRYCWCREGSLELVSRNRPQRPDPGGWVGPATLLGENCDALTEAQSAGADGGPGNVRPSSVVRITRSCS